MRFRNRIIVAALASWLCTMPAPARAELISTAIGLTALISGLGVSTAVAGAIGGAIIGVGVSVAVNLAAQLFKPKTASGAEALQTPTGVQSSLTVGAAVPRNAIVGPQATSGQLAYWNLYGDNNRFLQLVFTLGVGPHDDLTGIIVNGTRCTLGAYEGGGGAYTAYRPVTEFDKDSSHAMWVRFFNGFYDQVADQELIDFANPAGRWTSDNRGRGICYVSITLDYFNPEMWPQGVPQFLFELHGLRLYDRRKDSSNGGVGLHRWNDQHSWEYSANPALALYLFERGLYVGDRKQLGRGLAPIDLLSDLFVAAANICDEAVALKAGGTEPRYRLGMNIGVDRDWSGVEHDFCVAMSGWLMESAGAYGPIAGAAQSAVVTFTDDDLLGGREVRYAQKRSRSELINTIFGTYSDPAQNWQAIPYPARASSADIIVDNAEFAAQRDYPMLFSLPQVQRAGEIERRLARHQATCAVTLGFNFSNIEQGDWFTWVSARRDFTKTFLADRVSVADDDSITIAAREISADVFDFDELVDELDPLNPGDLAGINELVTAVPDFGLEGFQIPGVGGLTIPALRALWSPIHDRTIDDVLVEYRIVGTTDVKVATPFAPANGEGVISDAIQAATPYEARAGITTTPIRETFWTDWVAETAPPQHVVPTSRNVVAGGIDFAALAAEIQNTLDQVQPTVDRAADLLFRQNLIVKALQPVPPVGADQLTVESLIPNDVFARSDAALRAAMHALQLATQLRDQISEAGLGTHTQEGRWSIEGVGTIREGLTDLRASVGIAIDLTNATIALKADTAYVNDVAAAIIQGAVPAYRWEFNGTLEGWSASGCTVAQNAGSITVTATSSTPYIESPAIALDAGVNKIINVQIRRLIGTNWGVAVRYGVSFATERSVPVPVAPASWSLVGLDQRSDATWTGTITGIRIAFGGAIGDSFEIDFVELASFRLQDLLLAEVEARLASAEIDLDGLNASITEKANLTIVQDLTATVNDVIVALDAATDIITLSATQTAVDLLNERVTSAEVQINGALSQITAVVQTSGLLEAQAAGNAALQALLQIWQLRDRHAELFARGAEELRTYVDGLGGFVATVRQGLEAQVFDNRAAVQTEITARATAISAEASARLALAATVNDPITGLAATAASVVNESNVRATAVSAEATARLALAAVVNYPTTGLAATAASVVTEASARATAITAEANARLALAAVVNDPSTGLAATAASVVTEASARATAITAEASARTSLAAAIYQTGATFIQNTTPTATAIGNTWFNPDDATMHRWDGTTWVLVPYGGLPTAFATVLNEESARVSGDSAIASSVTAVSTTVSGHTASIGTLLLSTDGSSIFGGIVGEIDGVSGGLVLTGFIAADRTVQYSVMIRGGLVVDGTITGDKLDALSARIVILTANSVTSFHVGTNEIIAHTGNIAVLTVDTLHLVNGSVTDIFPSGTDGDLITTGPDWFDQEVISFSVTVPAGTRVTVEVTLSQMITSGGIPTQTRLFEAVGVGVLAQHLDYDGTVSVITDSLSSSFSYIASASTQPFTFKSQFATLGRGSGGGAPTHTNIRRLLVKVFKK